MLPAEAQQLHNQRFGFQVHLARELAVSKAQIAARVSADILTMLDRLSVDARPSALKQLLVELRDRHLSRICIFVVSRQTAAYVASVLSADGFDAMEISGQLSLETLEDVLTQFAKHGGIVVATDLITKGLEFVGAEVGISYEPPSSPATLRVRMTRAEFKEFYQLEVASLEGLRYS